ncbi:hypothetical protein ACNPAA_21120, partial [Aeromonas sp. PS2Canimalfood6]|uniref:hypothetical protein n=1 Tax=Aeromonas sp. PS2Canimalfood6 TaxID=3397770 RepID=UPI003AA9E202
KLCARRFACEADAQAELSCFTASLMLLQLDAEVVGEPVYTRHSAPIWGFIFGDDGYTFVANDALEDFEWVVAK